MIQMNLCTERKQTHIHRRQTYGYQRGKTVSDKLSVWAQRIHITTYIK